MELRETHFWACVEKRLLREREREEGGGEGECGVERRRRRSTTASTFGRPAKSPSGGGEKSHAQGEQRALGFIFSFQQGQRQRSLCDRGASKETGARAAASAPTINAGGGDKKKPSSRWRFRINLTFCSSACSAVSVCLPPAAADAPAGGPAEAPAGGGGPAPEGGCCISGGGKKEKKKRGGDGDEPASADGPLSLVFFSLLALHCCFWPTKRDGGRASVAKGGLQAEKKRERERGEEKRAFSLSRVVGGERERSPPPPPPLSLSLSSLPPPSAIKCSRE